tara:strand:- start:900 stop:1379 length:480 start_codon:yes stop_codon:yes gene_type:complete
MLPKPLYEILPYCYFIVGSTLWLASSTPLELFAGVLLYIAGAQQWVQRSNYRRSDRIRTNLINNHLHLAEEALHHDLYPRWLYEMLPFFYIGLGYQLANLFHNPSLTNILVLDFSFSLAAALSLIIAGFLVLTLRGRHRFQTHSDPVEPDANSPSSGGR